MFLCSVKPILFYLKDKVPNRLWTYYSYKRKWIYENGVFCFLNCFRTKKKTGILGTVLDAKTQPLAYVVVSIQNTNVMQLTAIDGKFNLTT
jgi:hypothetical protein